MDLSVQKAYCVPVDEKKKAYEKNISDMDKYTAFSPADLAILLRWIELRAN